MRIKITKSKNSESLYIIKSYRDKNGKSTTRIIEKLGTISSLLPKHNNSRDEVISWAKKRADFLTQKEKEDNLDVILKLSPSKKLKKDSIRTFNCGYLFLQDIFYELGIDDICKDISKKYNFEFNLTDILAKVIYARILNPASKLSTFEYSKKFIEAPLFELHHIYRALDILAEEFDYIQSSLYKNSIKIFKRNTSVLYYDCSNFFFEIEEADGDKQYGKSKENRPNPIIQMGLFLDGNGIPLACTIFPGNQSEQPSLIPLEKKIIKDFKLSKFIVCTDAGLASNNNRKFNNNNNRSYIVTQSLKKLKKHLKEWALDSNGWKLNNSTKVYNLDEIDDSQYYDKIFYKERYINENGIEQRLIVSYSPKYKVYQRNVRQGQIDRAKKLISEKKKVSHKNPNSSTRFISETKTTKNGEVADETYLSLDNEAIRKEEQFDGFYGVCTTLEDNIEEIIKINKQRWEIEESFRIMKTDFKSRPVYLQRDERIKAHFLTCFISLMIHRILEKKLNEQYTSTQIISTLREMNVLYHEGLGYQPLYTRTEVTDSLHEIFNIETDTEIITEKNMKKIIRQTKH